MKKIICVCLFLFLTGCNVATEEKELLLTSDSLNKLQHSESAISSERSNSTAASQISSAQIESSEIPTHDSQKWLNEQNEVYYLMADAVIKYSENIKEEFGFLFLNQARCALVDITDDGVPELFLSIPSWRHSSIYIFSYVDIESKMISCFEPALIAKSHSLSDFQIEIYQKGTEILLRVPDFDSSYNVYEEITRYYQISNSSIIQTAATCYQWKDTEDGNERYYEDEWANSEKEISKEEYRTYTQTILAEYQKIQDMGWEIEVDDYTDGDNLYLALKKLYTDYGE